MAAGSPSTGFVRFAWFNVFYLVLVILWGAWVRITGSGAGCGSHWPTCNGEVVPPSPTVETIIEYTHRLTSGLSLPLVIALVVWAFRLFPKGHRVRKAVIGTLLFLVSEALVGAGLVTFELVASNTSVERAVTAAFHLVNTFTLMACAVMAAWWAAGGGAPKWKESGATRWWILACAIGILLVSTTGAITALGDTLFPVGVNDDGGLAARVDDSLSTSTHFLVRLRIVHPIVAVVVALFILIYCAILRAEHDNERVRKYASGTAATVAAQTVLGVVNVMLNAPGWMQILHLLFALAIWVHLILLGGCILAEGESKAEAKTEPAPT